MIPNEIHYKLPNIPEPDATQHYIDSTRVPVPPILQGHDLNDNHSNIY